MAHNLPEQKDFISSKTIIMFGPACFSNMNNWFDTKGNRVSKVLNIMTNFENKKTWLHNTFTINEFWRHGTMYHWYIYTFESMVQYISDSIYNFEGTVHCIILIQLQFQRHGTMYQWYIYNGTMYNFNTFTICNLGFLPFHRLPCIVAAPRGQSAFPLKKERKFKKICKTEERRKIKKTWKTLSKEKSCCKGWRGVVSEITRCLIKFDMWLSDEKMIAEVQYAVL